VNALTEFDSVTGEILPPATGLYASVAAQMDKSLTTARAFPRSLARVGLVLSQFVSSDEKLAESCLYSLKRGGRTIQGPSARFAEALAYAYGHLRVDARLVEEGKDYIVVRGEAHDLERNVIFAQDVTRRIVDSKGRRFDVDLISVTYMAAASIAQRDCILKAIPSFIWRPAFEAVLQRITGDVKTLADRRVKAIGQFAVLGVSADQVFRKIGVATINDVTADHLVELVGTFQAIKAGDTTVEAEFGDTKITSKSRGGSPLAAPEDTGDPVASAASVADQAQAGAARLLDTPSADVPGHDAGRVAPKEEIANLSLAEEVEAASRMLAASRPKAEIENDPRVAQIRSAATDIAAALRPEAEIQNHPLAAQMKAAAETMAATPPKTTEKLTKWGPFKNFESALKQYEDDLLRAGSYTRLRQIASDWGARPFWNLSSEQAAQADAAYEAARDLFERRQKERESAKSAEAYESARNGADIDAATEVYRDPPDDTVGEAIEPEPAPPEHPHGLSLASFDDKRPNNSATTGDWEAIVNRLLQARVPDDTMAIFRACEQEGLVGRLDEDDQHDLRAVRFKIKNALAKK
jgi:hypothetical protein